MATKEKAQTARAAYNQKLAEIEDRLPEIRELAHNFADEKIHWGHVGTLEHIIAQLAEIRRSLRKES